MEKQKFNAVHSARKISRRRSLEPGCNSFSTSVLKLVDGETKVQCCPFSAEDQSSSLLLLLLLLYGIVLHITDCLFVCSFVCQLPCLAGVLGLMISVLFFLAIEIFQLTFRWNENDELTDLSCRWGS